MKKKGQLTIFVFVAVVVILIAFLMVTLVQRGLISGADDSKGEVQFENEKIERFYSNSRECLRDVAEKIINQIGTDKKDLIQEYLKVYGEKCFEESDLDTEVVINPPFNVEIIERGNETFVEINIDTEVNVLNQTSTVDSFSFEVSDGKEASDEEVIFVDEDAEVSFVYSNFSRPEVLEDEIIVEYYSVPEDIEEFETVIDSLPIIEREFLLNLSEIKELIYDEKLSEIIINHSYDEKMTYNASNISFKEISNTLLKFDFVKAVSRNSEFKLLDVDSDEILNDVFYNYQWYLNNEGQFFGKKGADINIKEAWDVTRGDSEVVIAVVDQGVFSNKDYAEHIIFSKSYNIVDNSRSVTPHSRNEYHGTHVTGIISSEGNNEYGIAGVCPDCSIINIRIANSRGEIESKDVVKGVLKAAAQGAEVISLSLGGGDYSSYEEGVFSELSNRGVVIVAAAGNEASSKKIYPAGYRGVISVGASNNLDRRAYFSNYGNWVDVYAPGEMIVSACGVNKFCFDSGTSMATPVVSGIVGLMLSINPDLKPSQVLSILKSSGEKIDYDKIRVDAGSSVKSLVSPEEIDVEANLTQNESEMITGILEMIEKKRQEILERRSEHQRKVEIDAIFREKNFSEILEFCGNYTDDCISYCSLPSSDAVLCNFVDTKK